MWHNLNRLHPFYIVSLEETIKCSDFTIFSPKKLEKKWAILTEDALFYAEIAIVALVFNKISIFAENWPILRR
jgi:hypothetical protein